MRSGTEYFFLIIQLPPRSALIPYTAPIRSPNLLASRRAANEGSAQQSLRTISSAEATYYSTAGNGNYGTMANLVSQSLVDSVLSGGLKSGYNFTTGSSPAASSTAFVAAAAPVTFIRVPPTTTPHFSIHHTPVLNTTT